MPHSFKELLERREIFHSKPKEEKGEPVQMTANAGRLSSETVRLLRAELVAISGTRPKAPNIFQDTNLPPDCQSEAESNVLSEQS